MSQKIQYCLVSSKWSDEAGAFVDTYHKDELYDLTDKASRTALARKALVMLAKGFKLKLITYVDRDSFDVADTDLF